MTWRDTVHVASRRPIHGAPLTFKRTVCRASTCPSAIEIVGAIKT